MQVKNFQRQPRTWQTCASAESPPPHQPPAPAPPSAPRKSVAARSPRQRSEAGGCCGLTFSHCPPAGRHSWSVHGKQYSPTKAAPQISGFVRWRRLARERLLLRSNFTIPSTMAKIVWSFPMSVPGPASHCGAARQARGAGDVSIHPFFCPWPNTCRPAVPADGCCSTRALLARDGRCLAQSRARSGDASRRSPRPDGTQAAPACRAAE